MPQMVVILMIIGYIANLMYLMEFHQSLNYFKLLINTLTAAALI